MFYQSRFYDPGINQFTQPDTLIPNLYNPLDWNRYAYARYNPVLYNDPTGHDPSGNCYDKGYCNNLAEAIQQMTQNQTSAEALVTMFASNDLPGDTPATRLNVILNATGSDSYLHFAIPYDDSGFPESLQDGSLWLSSSNQVGHFLTATDMAYSSSNESSDQFFLTLITGHEMSGDASYNTGSAANIKQIMLGASHPDAQSLFLQGGDENFGKILSEGDFSGDRTGNSMPDLRLSKLGWDFGKLTQLGAFASTDQQALFLRLSLGLYP